MLNLIKNDVELLSPAGSFECAKAAIESGADAIYMGGEKFGARAFAKSVKENSLIDAIKFTKENNKRFYITVNTLFKQKELKEVFLFLDDIVKEGVDAFIVQDIGVAEMLKNEYPDVELHASTQMAITSSKGIKLIKSLGFTQVVLARELTLKEIKEIKKEVSDIKLEAFVHGSMCYSYSGSCFMSSFIGGESGNRGHCKGPCRLPYKVIGSKNNAPYILSMKDMCAISFIRDLIKIGLSSFKIEGRMRQANYVSGVTKIYRKYIDAAVKSINNDNEIFFDEKTIKRDENYLLSLYDKGGFTNYYDKHNSVDMIQMYERK